MKKHILLSLLFFYSIVSYSQPTSLVLSSNSICLGETITAKAILPNFSLFGATGANNQNGNMFDITADLECIIKDFSVKILQNNTSLEVYYKTGTHVGFANSSVGWTIAGTASGIDTGNDIKLNLDLKILMVLG